jgi:hypothetical protein
VKRCLGRAVLLRRPNLAFTPVRPILPMLSAVCSRKAFWGCGDTSPLLNEAARRLVKNPVSLELSSETRLHPVGRCCCAAPILPSSPPPGEGTTLA